MPFPTGHTAIGFAVNEIMAGPNEEAWSWKKAAAITALANLPDLDILVGLVFTGNGMIWHRGPSHSLLFCVAAAGIAWWLVRRGRLPSMGFAAILTILLSHVLADAVLTSGSVSLLWPLEVSWSGGFAGWSDIVYLALVRGLTDIGIVLVCAALILLTRSLRRARRVFPRSVER